MPLREVVDDLEDEHAVLDGLVAGLTPAEWHTPTPAEGWDIADTITHLTLSDEAAVGSVTGRGREVFEEVIADPDAALTGQAQAAQSQSEAEILAWWRRVRGQVLDGLRALAPNEKVYWGIGEMSARSLATARLMECWAHGLDCFAALGAPVVDTDRVRHVCHLGYRTLPYAFDFAGREMPAPRDDLRLELTAPDGVTLWQFGADDAPQVVRGAAGEWARLSVRRLALADVRTLTADGPLAEAALEVTKAYLF
jgi:uncharacterized protein (TIGR03084 family)